MEGSPGTRLPPEAPRSESRLLLFLTYVEASPVLRGPEDEEEGVPAATAATATAEEEAETSESLLLSPPSDTARCLTLRSRKSRSRW